MAREKECGRKEHYTYNIARYNYCTLQHLSLPQVEKGHAMVEKY